MGTPLVSSIQLLATMLLLTTLKLTHASVEQSAIRLSTFHLVSAVNIINQTRVNRTYDRTESALHCGMRCSNIMVPSFYFVGETSTCYCNNDLGPDIAPGSEPGSITYGILVAEKTTHTQGQIHEHGPRQGNSSECQALYDTGVRDDDVYNDTTGEQMFCNMTALGWVVFQRRQDGSVDFHRNWTEYANGFGDPYGEFWLGLDALYQATQNGCELHIYLEAEPNNTVQYKGFAWYSSFSVSNSTDNYLLHVGGYTGNGLGDNLSLHDGHMFTTFDVDNDSNGSGNCAQSYSGAWWFIACFRSNLNGAYLGGHTDLYAKGIIWYSWKGFHYSLLKSEMAYRC